MDTLLYILPAALFIVWAVGFIGIMSIIVRVIQREKTSDLLQI